MKQRRLEGMPKTGIKTAAFAREITARKYAVVVPIPKPVKPGALISSYRPISLFSILSNFYEGFDHQEQAFST